MFFLSTTASLSFAEGFGFHRDALDKESNKESIENIISNALKTRVQLKLEMEAAPQIDHEQEKRELVQDVIDVFGEDLVEIEE